VRFAVGHGHRVVHAGRVEGYTEWRSIPQRRNAVSGLVILMIPQPEREAA
jgi:hypothetical protein